VASLSWRGGLPKDFVRPLGEVLDAVVAEKILDRDRPLAFFRDERHPPLRRRAWGGIRGGVASSATSRATQQTVPSSFRQ